MRCGQNFLLVILVEGRQYWGSGRRELVIGYRMTKLGGKEDDATWHDPCVQIFKKLTVTRERNT